jgi:hypothetical protein
VAADLMLRVVESRPVIIQGALRHRLRLVPAGADGRERS